MKMFLFLILALPSMAFAICCNKGGQAVQGNPFQTQQGCVSQANANNGFFWTNGDTCPRSGECCQVKTPVQGVYQDCAALEAQLQGMSGADIVGRCNQINGGQSCQWTCGAGTGAGNGNSNGNGGTKPIKVIKDRIKRK